MGSHGASSHDGTSARTSGPSKQTPCNAHGTETSGYAQQGEDHGLQAEARERRDEFAVRADRGSEDEKQGDDGRTGAIAREPDNGTVAQQIPCTDSQQQKQQYAEHG